MQAIYSAASGLKNQQTRLDNIAANIANSNTPGYKSTRIDFKDALYTLMDSPSGDSSALNLLTGSGVLIGATGTDFSDGILMSTGSALDFAISGSGFFTVENASGDKLYTRNGSFSISTEEDGNYLVTAQGYYVLDPEGNRITLPADATELSVTTGGVLSTPEGELATMSIVDFSNPDGLSSVGGTCFEATEVSGDPMLVEDVTVIQGSLEGSNVELAQELTLMIRSQRAYSLASKALQTADDMEGLSNNMR